MFTDFPDQRDKDDVIEEPIQPICAFSDREEQPNGSCDGCTDYIWTSTYKQSSVSTACPGDTIIYTITFTNYSIHTLEGVRISDIVPAEVTVLPDSITPPPQPGERLQTGISMGSITPEQSVVLTYNVIVAPGTCGMIENKARAEYCYLDGNGCCRHGIGSLRSCIVNVYQKCLCQCTQKRIPFCDFNYYTNCHLYYINSRYYNNGRHHCFKVDFAIIVRYINHYGNKKRKIFKSSLAYHNLPNDFDPTCFFIQFLNLECFLNNYRDFSVRFDSKLYYCEKT